MAKKVKNTLATILAFTFTVGTATGLMAGCKKKTDKEQWTYTNKTYSSSLSDNWNPHTWEKHVDDTFLSYVSTPLVDMTVLDKEEETWQWVYEMATSVTDVTKDHKDDLVKYKVADTLTAAEKMTEGYVFEIGLNDRAVWENGEKITADTYVDSMELLLNSHYRNYRANLYWGGESAVAGGLTYYNSEAPIYEPIIPPYEDEPDYSRVDENHIPTAEKYYINLTSDGMTVAPYSFATMKDDYGYIRDEKNSDGEIVEGRDGAKAYERLQKMANPYGYIEVTEENRADVLLIADQYLSAFGLSAFTETGETNWDYFIEMLFYNTGRFGDKAEYADTVGFYKVDDYTVRYVCEAPIEWNSFMTSLTSNWLVYKPLYEKTLDKTGILWTTKYNTSPENTMSYGVYKMTSYQKNKQAVFEQNETWYGFDKDENGKAVRDEHGLLHSSTKNAGVPFKVDGEYRDQYQTTKVVIDVMTDDTAKLEFLKGNLTDWTTPSSDLSKYSLSSQLYQVDETYTQSFFFNTNLDALRTMDADKGNKYSVVLTNRNFRKAFSLSIDRSEWVTATAGYKPSYALMNGLYHYDIYNDPTSSYRKSDEAMQAVCDLYGVEYGADKIYKTLTEAYNSVTGYNLTQAKELMKTAHDELVAAGLYPATGTPEIVINVAYKKGALDSDDQRQMTLMNNYLNAAVEGTGFGKVTLVAVGNLADRYGDVPAGNYAIGYGAWGGAAFYPFRNMQVYFDTVSYAGQINEIACWDPETTEITCKVPTYKGGADDDYSDEKNWDFENMTDETKTAYEWSGVSTGKGVYATAPNKVNLIITAQLENWFLNTYYRIPLASSTACFLLSYQVSYYTESYNIMYAFGGDRLMKYNYNDAEWAAFIASNDFDGYEG